MFAYIKGTLQVKGNDFVVIENNNIGYKIFMPKVGIDALGEIGIEVKIYTYYYVREDNISLYGFSHEEQLRMFELLLSVSGVGAKSANIILSSITPSDFALAIISNDTSKLVKIPGIGAKSAARIILELKDKMKTQMVVDEAEKEVKAKLVQNDCLQEACDALKVLGYNVKEIEKVLQSIDTSNMQVEDIIRKALLKLAK